MQSDIELLRSPMSTQSANSRPLAPAPPSVGHIESGPESPSATSSSTLAGIKRASTACQSCKQIKRKCDQAQPCSNCRKSRTRCVYNEAEDGRRKAARKRTVESLELKRDALDSILDLLRNSDDQHVQQLLLLIKSQAPLDEIVQYAADYADKLPEDQLRNFATLVNGRPRKNVLSVVDLCDTPIFKVPSKPWTNVTDDNDLVSHLISIYFTWFHIAYPIMNQRLFLRDMARGDANSQFCSPLLVNSMLTMACHFSDHPRACKIPSDPNTRGRHFLDEATRLWNEQESKPSLLNIQAILILAVSSTLVGKDRLSWSYVEQANAMIQELSIKSTQARTRGTQEPSPDLRDSHSLTSWACFLLTVGYGIAFMKPLPATLPTDMGETSYPDLDHYIRWFPYPQRSPEVSVAWSELHRAYCTLHTIGMDVQRLHFGSKSKAQDQDIFKLDQRFLRWRHALAESLHIRTEQHTINPQNMDLHLTYHWLRITLFNFMKTPRSTPATPPAELDPEQLRARSQLIESASSVAELCKQFSRDIGLKQVTIWMPQTAVSAAYSLIDMLVDALPSSTLHDVFHELCLVLVAASQRWLVMKGHVRMLLLTAEEKGQKLPKKTKDLLQFTALNKWGEKDHLQFASASYPNYALAKDEDPRLAAMGDLLEKWADFQQTRDAEEAIVEHAHTLTSVTSRTTDGSDWSPSDKAVQSASSHVGQ